MTRLGLGEVQKAISDRQVASRRDDIEVVALDRHPVDCLSHDHRCMAGQQIDHHAFVGRIKVLDKDEGHAAIGRQRGQKFPACVESARGGADPDDGEASVNRRRATSERAPARPW